VSVEATLFFVVGAVAIALAVLMVVQRNPVMSAIYLIGNFFCLALLYLLLRAQLLAVLQIVVYTGAIMVLVVFVIMLLNLGDEKRLSEQLDTRKIVGLVLVFGFLLEVLFIVGGSETEPTRPALHPNAGTIGTVESMGTALFGKFLLPFELTSLLLLAAIVGAVVLAKRRVNTES
jgi:NADH-quinone oxidoreductase subunit J